MADPRDISVPIVNEIHIDATVDRVWTVITAPEEVGKWFGSGAPAEIDLRPGGRMVFDHGEYGVLFARVEKVDEPHYLSYRWAHYTPETEPDAGNSTLVEFTLTPGKSGGTALRVVESGFDLLATPDAADQYGKNSHGWPQVLEGLVVQAQSQA